MQIISFLMLSRLVYFSLQAMGTQQDSGIRLSGHVLQAIGQQTAHKVNEWLNQDVNLKVKRKKPNKTYLEVLPQNLQQLINKYVVDDVARAACIAQAIENTKSYVNQNPQLVAKLMGDKFGQYPYEVLKPLIILDNSLLCLKEREKNELARRGPP